MITNPNLVLTAGKLKFHFNLKYQLTFIRGSSGIGKSTFYDYIHKAITSRRYVGVDIECDLPVKILDDDSDLGSLHSNQHIYIIEGNRSFVKDHAFSEFVKQTDNYFIIMDRRYFGNLEYNIGSLCTLESDGNNYCLKPGFPDHFYIV